MTARHPLLLASTLSTLLVGGALVWGLHHGAAAAAHATVAVPVTDASTAPAHAVAQPVSAALAPAPVAAPVAHPAAPSPESLARRVDRLSRSGDPVESFEAYKLVTACLWARDHESWMTHHILPGDRELLPTTQQACGDIASDQVQSRLRWLERAALAGVHRAATEMLKEGPDGLGVSGSSDIDAPENAAWKQRLVAAQEAGVRTCDPDSLEGRVNSYETGLGVPQDRARALTYWVAYRDCRQRLVGVPGALLANADSVTQRMGTTLTADQIARAVAEGQQIARDATPLPGDD